MAICKSLLFSFIRYNGVENSSVQNLFTFTIANVTVLNVPILHFSKVYTFWSFGMTELIWIYLKIAKKEYQ